VRTSNPVIARNAIMLIRDIIIIIIIIIIGIQLEIDGTHLVETCEVSSEFA
jgi:hypothetical protein